MTARLLMIGLDGADGGRLDRGSADGSLPHLAALRARGRAHRLTAPPGVTDDALWASFQYGVPLGEHGRYFYRIPRAGGRLSKAWWAETSRATFWDELSDQGRRVAVIDVPKCRNPRPLNGLQLTDWLTHGGYYPKPRSKPRSLAAELPERFGSPPPCRCDYQMAPLSDGEVREVATGLAADIAAKRAAGLHYLHAEPWDLFVIGFMEAHCAGHTFWDFDLEHPDHDPHRRGRLGDPVTRVLQDLDAAVGALVEAAGPAAEVVVFSTTDMQPNGSLDHLAPGIVAALTARLSTGGPDAIGCSLLPYSDNCLALRITGEGGARADPAMLRKVEAELETMRDATTGEAIISALIRPSSEWNGSRSVGLPDLLIHASAGQIPCAVASPTLGRIEAHSPPRRPGNHAAGGFVIAAGSKAAGACETVRTLADFGPAAQAILGGPADAVTAPAANGVDHRPSARSRSRSSAADQ